MHELSIALSLLDVAELEADQRGVQVAAIHVRVGPLSGVVPGALLSAYELAREGTPFEQCSLVLEETTIAVYCPRCLAERSVVSIQDIRCARCGEVTPDIRRGRELEIFAMEVVDVPADATRGSAPEGAQAK